MQIERSTYIPQYAMESSENISTINRIKLQSWLVELLAKMDRDYKDTAYKGHSILWSETRTRIRKINRRSQGKNIPCTQITRIYTVEVKRKVVTVKKCIHCKQIFSNEAEVIKHGIECEKHPLWDRVQAWEKSYDVETKALKLEHHNIAESLSKRINELEVKLASDRARIIELEMANANLRANLSDHKNRLAEVKKMAYAGTKTETGSNELRAKAIHIAKLALEIADPKDH